MDTHQYSFLNRKELNAALRFHNSIAENEDYPAEDLAELEKLNYFEFLIEFEKKYGLIIKNYREQKQLSYLKTIKNIAVFYVVLSIIIGIVFAIVFLANS